MTIGVGFKCSDGGIVIAADTRYTQGSIKSHGPKLFPLFAPAFANITDHTYLNHPKHRRPDLAVIIAGAGNVPLMKRAVEKIESALDGCSDPTAEDVRTIAEDTLIHFFQTHVYPSPVHAELGFELIIGVWTRTNNEFGLFKSTDTTVTPVGWNDNCSIGMGQYVSEYALGFARPAGSITLGYATFLATLCVKAAKDYVDYCGGSTHVWAIRDRTSNAWGHLQEPSLSVWSVPDSEVKEMEQYSEDLFSIFRKVIAFLDPEWAAEDKLVEIVTGELKQSILVLRQKQRVRKEQIRKALQEAAKPPAPGGSH